MNKQLVSRLQCSLVLHTQTEIKYMGSKLYNICYDVFFVVYFTTLSVSDYSVSSGRMTDE
jgi:hypothetical protein